MNRNLYLIGLIFFNLVLACNTREKSEDLDSDTSEKQTEIIQPFIVTEPVKYDTDDPAIWINQNDPEKSLVLGTDKKSDGALYVFDLEGKIIDSLSIRQLKRPNNVDIAYGLLIDGKETDIAVVTERETHKLRIFSLPDMKPLDHGGLPMFEGEVGEGYRDLMGIGLYKDPLDKEIHAIVGRKEGPQDGTYLWQYKLSDDGKHGVKSELIRKFGHYSGEKEIEAIAIDSELGFVYYSDETVGVRKYHANPELGNEELALFAQKGFERDHEGISIFKTDKGKGYILVSDQQSNAFHIFPREGTPTNPHEHPLLKKVYVAAQESDGSDVTSQPLNETFSQGLFVVMSTDKTFHYYRWEDIWGDDFAKKEASENDQLDNEITAVR